MKINADGQKLTVTYKERDNIGYSTKEHGNNYLLVTKNYFIWNSIQLNTTNGMEDSMLHSEKGIDDNNTT